LYYRISETFWKTKIREEAAENNKDSLLDIQIN